MGRIIDLIGQQFGRLIVIRQCGKNKNSSAVWLCKCDCGNTSTAIGKLLRNGHVKSCGCLAREGNNTKHGHLRDGETSPTYNTWSSMIQRCSNPKHKSYNDYGGRGIVVCERWKNFENFLSDMGERPVGTQIDRINNDIGYSPDNCCWVTRKIQCRNRRSNHLETCRGKTQTLKNWAEETGVSYDLIRFRLRRGWSMEKALTTPTG